MDKTVAKEKHGSGSAAEAAPSTKKQPYVRPELNAYGSLREITTQLGLIANSDNAPLLAPLIRTGVVT